MMLPTPATASASSDGISRYHMGKSGHPYDPGAVDRGRLGANVRTITAGARKTRRGCGEDCTC